MPISPERYVSYVQEKEGLPSRGAAIQRIAEALNRGDSVLNKVPGLLEYVDNELSSSLGSVQQYLGTAAQAAIDPFLEAGKLLGIESAGQAQEGLARFAGEHPAGPLSAFTTPAAYL